MSENNCPVHRCILDVRNDIESSRLATPRSRRLAEEILELLLGEPD